jgi:hypothetical protein
MAKKDPYGFSKAGKVLLEAEVASSGLTRFSDRYYAATGRRVSSGSTPNFQKQSNKWGAELRIYFDSPKVATELAAHGIHVEEWRPYRGEYQFRINSGEMWWDLVENYGYRLGKN